MTAPYPHRHAAGFTLVELITIIIIGGILAIAVLPRLSLRSSYDQRVFEDELISVARSAQQLAMMRGNGFTVRFTIDNANQRYGIELRQGAGAWVWQSHANTQAFPIAYPNDIVTAPALVQVTYNALGSAVINGVADVSQAITINGNPALCIRGTGYSHRGTCA